MSQYVKLTLLLLCTLGLLYFVWSATPSPNPNVASAQGVVSHNGREPAHTIRILFIGNSYTFVNDMPAMLVDIASSDGKSPYAVEVKSITRGGARLIEWWNDPKQNAEKAILAQHWDYVVLQDQSEWALLPEWREDNRTAVKGFSDFIRKSGATPLLYLTWMRKPGCPCYDDPQSPYFYNPDYMHATFHYYTMNLGSEFRIPVIPAGDIWAICVKNRPALNLYQPDSSHPTPAGTYLVALTFYRYLTSRPLDEITFVPSGVKESDAAYLRSLVASYKER